MCEALLSGLNVACPVQGQGGSEQDGLVVGAHPESFPVRSDSLRE